MSAGRDKMRFWRRSNDSIRWLAVIGIMFVLFAALDLYDYGSRSLRWMESASLAVACLAAVALEDPPRRDLPWRQQLRTSNGLVAACAFVVSLGLILWRNIHG